MKMISFAQNLEDVLLDRALRDVRKGFYIDVGANHPTKGSVTHHFHLLGWSGVNVEPCTIYEKLAAERKRDVNLRVAVSKTRGEATMYEFPETGISTLSREQAEENRRSHGRSWRELRVPLVPLSDICAEHARRVIDFLSVDVEGHELEVLESNDWRKHRPRIVVVEATLPNTETPTHQRWEHLLLGADYHFAVSDGLNRFYVRDEDRSRIAALQVHPNIFDEYVQFHVQERIHELEAKLHKLECRYYWRKGLLRKATQPFTRLAKKVKQLFRGKAA